MLLARSRRLGLAAASALLAALFLTPLPAAGAPQELDPCARLNAGEVRYSVREAKRVTFATTEKYGATRARLTNCVFNDGAYVQEWQAWGFSGRNGFAPPGSMWENTLYSPTGSFSFTEALGRSNPGTELEYHELNPSSRWGGAHGPTYNQYFEGKGEGADENLWRYMEQGLYEQAAVINWNRPPDMPTRQGASFAIFFHAGYAPTWGCISADLSTVVKLLRTAVPGDRIVMGTVEDVFTASTADSEAAAAAARAEERAAAVEEKLELVIAGLLALMALAGAAFALRLAFTRSLRRRARRAGRAGRTRRSPPRLDAPAPILSAPRLQPEASAAPRTGWSPPVRSDWPERPEGSGKPPVDGSVPGSREPARESRADVSSRNT